MVNVQIFTLSYLNHYFVFTDTCTKVIIPLVQKFCENCTKYGKESVCKVSKLFGKLCHGLSGKLLEKAKKPR